MIFCGLHQWLWSRSYDENRCVSALTRRHIKHCTRCAEFTSAMAQVDNDLKKQCGTPSEEWHESVIRDVRHLSQPTVHPIRFVRTFPVALAAAALICATLVVRWGNTPREEAAPEMSMLPESSFILMVEEITGGSLEHESKVLERDALRAIEIATSMLPI